MIPVDRPSFVQWCLRRLGQPVIEINVEADQIDDRVDEALNYYSQFHFDGSERQFYKYQVQAQDMINKYVTLPANIIGVVSIFPIGSSLSTNNLFNIRYQIALNDLYDLTATTMVPYYLSMQHIQFLEQLLVGMQPIRYNRRNNILYIDMDWTRINPGEYILVEAYGVVDPLQYSSVWNDWWLQKYSTALIKRQWGENLIKFRDVSLPGGVKFNGEKIFNDAMTEINDLEKSMITDWSEPPTMMIG